MDNNTTDKAWAAMRNLLDREMPLNRRRRFVWWWLGLLLLPIASYGTWQWLNFNNAAPEQKLKDAPALPIASAPPVSEPAIIDPMGKSVPNATAYSVSIHSGLQAPAAKQSQMQVPEKFFQQEQGTGMLFQTNYSAPVPKQPLDLLPISAHSIDLQDKKINPPHSFATASITLTRKKTSKSHWALGATSSISTEQFSTINGFSTGATVDWKFARKWGLRTGLLYNIHAPQEKSRPVASVLSDSYTSSVDGNVIVVDVYTGAEVSSVSGNNYYTDSLGWNVFIPVNRLQRLELPVSIFWQATRPLKAFAGVSLTRTLSTTANRQNYSGDYILKLADQSAEDDASKLSSSELDNWSADAMLGLGLRVSKKFEVGLSAKMPFGKFPSFTRKEHSFNGSLSVDDTVDASRKKSSPLFSLYGTLFF